MSSCVCAAVAWLYNMHKKVANRRRGTLLYRKMLLVPFISNGKHPKKTSFRANRCQIPKAHKIFLSYKAAVRVKSC